MRSSCGTSLNTAAKAWVGRERAAASNSWLGTKMTLSVCGLDASHAAGKILRTVCKGPAAPPYATVRVAMSSISLSVSSPSAAAAAGVVVAGADVPSALRTAREARWAAPA